VLFPAPSPEIPCGNIPFGEAQSSGVGDPGYSLRRARL